MSRLSEISLIGFGARHASANESLLESFLLAKTPKRHGSRRYSKVQYSTRKIHRRTFAVQFVRLMARMPVLKLPTATSMAPFRTMRNELNGGSGWLDEVETRSGSELSTTFCQLQTAEFRRRALTSGLSVANGCFELVCHSEYLKYNVCELESPGQRRDCLPRPRIDEFLPPVVQYACLHWVSHIEQVEPKIKDGGQVHIFLQRSFLYWLEALSVLGKASEAIPLIDEIRVHVDVSHLKHPI